MKLEDELTAALIVGYERAGKEVGYWAHRYVQALRRNGGVADGEYEIDPIKELRPVCPNCHAMLHRGEELLSIAELKATLSKNRGAGD